MAKRLLTGAEVKRHFLNTSPEPVVNTVNVEDLRKGNFAVAPRVLVVDDDSDNLRYVTGVLVMAGYGVVQARDGVEGLRTFREDNVGFSLVLSDWSMPNMMGTEMLRRVRRNYPKQRVMMMSSDPARVRSDLRNNRMADVRVLDKGFDPHELERAVKTAIEASNEATH